MDGIWIRAEEAWRTKQVATANLKAFESWRKVIGDQKKLLASSSSKRHNAAIQALMKIQVPESIPVMEAAFASGNEQEQLLFKTWVCRLNSWKASASLARLAISTDSARVRLETIKELKRRPLEEFAPTILSAMATPIQIRIETQKYGMWTLYNQVAQYETQNQEHRFHYTARYAPEFLFQTPGSPRQNLETTSTGSSTPAHGRADHAQPGDPAGETGWAAKRFGHDHQRPLLANSDGSDGLRGPAKASRVVGLVGR